MFQPLRNLQEAHKALDYFNGFHDAFIKELCITSHDRFEDRGVQSQSSHLDVEILFAHYNYREGEPPPNQLIRTIFARVKGIDIHFSGLSYDWSVNHVDIQGTYRIAEANMAESCLSFALWQPRLNDRREWELHRVLSFTFTSGEFVEIV